MIFKIALLLALIGAAFIWWRRHTLRANPMRPAEARRILQLPDQASADQVREAHRRLIARVHPDAGGSADLATRVNAARDTLLEELKRKR